MGTSYVNSGSAMPAEMGAVEVPTVPGALAVHLCLSMVNIKMEMNRTSLLQVKRRRMTSWTDLDHRDAS